MKILPFFYDVSSWSYRRLVTVVTISYILLSWLILAILGTIFFVGAELIFPVVLFTLGFVWIFLVVLKKKTTSGTNWTVGIALQIFKDFRYGRHVRKTKELTEQYEGEQLKIN